MCVYHELHAIIASIDGNRIIQQRSILFWIIFCVPMDTLIPFDTKCCTTSKQLSSSGASVTKATSDILPYLGSRSVKLMKTLQ